MRAGLLSEVIKFELPIIETDDFGANSLRWETFINKTKSLVTYSTGNRVNENNEIIFAYEVDFTIRSYHQINERMRIIWLNRKYRILSIQRMKEQLKQIIKAELINE